MCKITTALFDFDGVVADTEPLYDIFWNEMAKIYHLGIPEFAAKIKGTTLSFIFKTYFSSFPEEEIRKIAFASTEYELKMDFPEVSGSVNFIERLKERNVRLGLVTSSSSVKMQVALKKMGLEGLFDTVITADEITKGKPDPMGYLLAAKNLQSAPTECVVFEDSFAGIQAGNAAGAKVIGLSTTNSADSIRDKVYTVIPDFRQPESLLKLFS